MNCVLDKRDDRSSFRSSDSDVLGEVDVDADAVISVCERDFSCDCADLIFSQNNSGGGLATGREMISTLPNMMVLFCRVVAAFGFLSACSLDLLV